MLVHLPVQRKKNNNHIKDLLVKDINMNIALTCNNSRNNSTNDNSVYNKLNLTSQEILLLRSLEEFYQNKEYYDILVSIIEGTSTISRRTFEYFVTNYASKHNIIYDLDEKGVKTSFNVYSSYKDQLKAHRKKYFDPFGRGDRIPFFCHDDCIITTIGQLNFYRWFFIKKIYEYCAENYTPIQTELLANKHIKKRATDRVIRKRPATAKKNISYIKVEYDPDSDNDMVVSFTF